MLLRLEGNPPMTLAGYGLPLHEDEYLHALGCKFPLMVQKAEMVPMISSERRLIGESKFSLGNYE